MGTSPDCRVAEWRLTSAQLAECALGTQPGTAWHPPVTLAAPCRQCRLLEGEAQAGGEA